MPKIPPHDSPEREHVETLTHNGVTVSIGWSDGADDAVLVVVSTAFKPGVDGDIRVLLNDGPASIGSRGYEPR